MIETTATDLFRLMHCMGSLSMPASLPPDVDREAREEGNAAHWVAQRIFLGGEIVPGVKAPNGYIVTETMIEHVNSYVSMLDCGDMEIDTTHSTPQWKINGRADHVKWREDLLSLTIDDFKYGYRLVEPVENWTLISHAIGWCQQNQKVPQRIDFRIHQPRPYHPNGTLRVWSIDYNALIGFYERINAQLCNPEHTLRTNAAVCAKCHALPTCPAARAASMNAVDVISMVYSDDLPNDILIHEYELLNAAEATIVNRREAIEELMTFNIREGKVFENYGLVTRYGQTRWKTGLNGQFLTAATGIDLTKDGVVTPAEAKRRGVPEKVIEKLTDRPIIGTKLSKIDPAIQANKFFKS